MNYRKVIEYLPNEPVIWEIVGQFDIKINKKPTNLNIVNVQGLIRSQDFVVIYNISKLDKKLKCERAILKNCNNLNIEATHVTCHNCSNLNIECWFLYLYSCKYITLHKYCLLFGKHEVNNPKYVVISNGNYYPNLAAILYSNIDYEGFSREIRYPINAQFKNGYECMSTQQILESFNNCLLINPIRNI